MNQFVKLIIVTDGNRFRAFRFSARNQRHELFFHCGEIEEPRFCPPPAPANEAAADEAISADAWPDAADCVPAANLEALANLIEDLVSEVQPQFWNLVAPAGVAERLPQLLGSDAGERLTRTISGNMINDSLAQVVLRFPPLPCAAPPCAPRGRRHAGTPPAGNHRPDLPSPAAA